MPLIVSFPNLFLTCTKYVYFILLLFFTLSFGYRQNQPHALINYYYNNGTAHNHNLRHQALSLPMTKKEYFVQSIKYQLLKLIRETSQLDLDRCLTSPRIQFVAYFKYKIIEAYNPVCDRRKYYVCQ